MKINRAKSIISAIAGGLVTIALILYAIDAFIGLKEMADTDTSGYSEALKSMLASTKALTIIDVIVVFIAMIFGVATIISAFSNSRDKHPAATLTTALIILSVEKIIAVLGGVIILKKYMPGLEVDGSSIAVIVLLFITLILFIICRVTVTDSTKDIASGVCGIISTLIFLVVIIIVLSSANSDTLSIMYLVFLMIALLATIALFVFVLVPNNTASGKTTYFSYDPYRPKVNGSESSINKPATEPRPAPVTQKAEPEDPVKKLTELKKLLDDGIISEEEYQEKRKKYIEKL